MFELHTLRGGDEQALERFLVRHADSSMFLRSNARAAGLEDNGKPYQATYVAARLDGEVVAVAAHCWNGSLLVQAPEHTGMVAHAAVERSGRAVRGIVGPWEQVLAARDALRLDGRAIKESREDLFALSLADLVLPAALAEGRVRCRPPTERELELLFDWRAAYCCEALGATDGAALRSMCRSDVRRSFEDGTTWVLTDGRHLLATSTFNARLPDVVQIGGVWTPPELRGRDYARSVVAGSLVLARETGVTRSILFTGEDNPAARNAYLAIGFRIIGGYGLALFDNP